MKRLSLLLTAAVVVAACEKGPHHPFDAGDRSAAAARASAGASAITASIGTASSTGQIYACVTRTGSIQIVSSDQTCRAVETLLTWNVQGPAGPAGPMGPAGPPGPPGVSGHRVLWRNVEGQQGSVFADADCPPGQVATGGGAAITGTSTGRERAFLKSSWPKIDFATGRAVGWATWAQTASPSTSLVRANAYAICANAY